MTAKLKQNMGFTITELLIVIVIIGILAAITVVSYSGIQKSAQNAKMKIDLANLSKAIALARTSTSKTLLQITGDTYSAGFCFTKPTGTNLALLPISDVCRARYLSTLDALSIASGVNIRNIADAWGRPYAIDENEGESGGCYQDTLGVYSQPFVTDTYYSGGVAMAVVPLSGLTGCAL